MSHPETVPVEQVERLDREAAWPFRPSCYKEDTKERWMAGVYDRAAPVIAAFARYRIAALQAAAERERTLVEAMEQADYEAHLAIEKGMESGAIYWREGLEQVQATLSSALKHGQGERDAVLEEAARVAEEYPSNDGFAIPVVRGIAQAIRTLKSTTSGERSPTRAEDEALRTAHQSSTTLVEYLDTPPNIGTAEQAAQKCDALAATYPSGSEARSALHNAALMIRAIKDIPSAEGRQ